MPRDKKVVLAELEEELARIPALPSPDLTRAIYLGFEAGWQKEIRTETYGGGIRHHSILHGLQGAMMFGGTMDEERGKLTSGQGMTLCYTTMGPWMKLYKALREWEGNHHLVWPIVEPSIS